MNKSMKEINSDQEKEDIELRIHSKKYFKDSSEQLNQFQRTACKSVDQFQMDSHFTFQIIFQFQFEFCDTKFSVKPITI